MGFDVRCADHFKLSSPCEDVMNRFKPQQNVSHTCCSWFLNLSKCSRVQWPLDGLAVVRECNDNTFSKLQNCANEEILHNTENMVLGCNSFAHLHQPTSDKMTPENLYREIARVGRWYIGLCVINAMYCQWFENSTVNHTLYKHLFLYDL